MRVTLTKRLGQNKPGTVIDTTITQARWMYERGVATAAGDAEQERGDQAATAEQPADADAAPPGGEDSTSEAPKATRGRRAAKTVGNTKPSGE